MEKEESKETGRKERGFKKVKLGFIGYTVLPSRKSDREISKSDFYQTIFLPKVRPKADPNSLFRVQNQTCSQNIIPTLGKSTFI